LDDRTDLISGENDSLWSDATLVQYFNEYERRLCRRAWVLTDIGNPTAGVIVLATGKSLYQLHKSVLRVRVATPAEQEFPLSHATDAQLTEIRPTDKDWFDVNSTEIYTPGAPLAISTDAATRTMRVVPAPAAAQNGLRVILKTVRMPVCPLTLDKPDASPEVPEEWHSEVLCLGAAGKCLTHPNVDASAKTEGRNLLAQVEATIREARQEMLRAEGAEARFQFSSDTARIR
jgi:hypothetical protein